MPDSNGYPTEKELAKIRTWGYGDVEGWMRYICSVWWMPDWGWSEYSEPDGIRYEVSTGGWSGNEQIISAMRENFLCWSQTWEVHRKGGHYTFRLRRREGNES